MNEREEANRFECCERCGEPPALCGCWSTNNDLVGRLRSELSALRQQLAEKEQDFQVVKLAVIETEGRCAEFKAMLDDTLKQEFAVRQQLAEARAYSDAKARLIVMQREELRRLGMQLSMARYEAAHARTSGALKLAAQAAELERLRDAAEKSVTAFEHYQMTCREHRSPYIKENGRHGASPYAELVESYQGLRSALTTQQEQGK